MENNTEDEISNRQIQFISMLSDTVSIIENKIKSSQFITNIIISLFDKDLIEDITQMKEFLNDLKEQIAELRLEYLEMEKEQNG